MASIFKIKGTDGKKYCVSASSLKELKDKGKICNWEIIKTLNIFELVKIVCILP